MANFGIGLGAFLNGVANGANAYANIKDLASRSKMRDAQVADMEQQRADKQQYRSILKQNGADATAARQQDINNQISTGTDATGQPTYSVAGKSYANQAEATAAAEGQVGGFLDYWKKTAAPKLQQYWVENGDIDKAQNFSKWMEDSNVQEGMKNWANMARSFQVGDREGFLTNLNKTLTTSGYYDGAVQPIEASEKTNDKGQLLGYTVKFRDKGTGKESTQDFDSDDIQKLAVTGLSPSQIYSQGVDDMRAAKAARAAAVKTQDERQWEATKMDRQQQNTLESQANQSQLRRAEKVEEKRLGLGDASKDPLAKAKATESYLRDKGYSDDYIKKNAPALVGIQNQNKPRSSRIDDYIKLQTENDRAFSKLPLSQKIDQANKYIDTVDAASNGNISETPASTSQQPAKRQPGRRLFWDNNSQSMIER